MKPKSSNPIKLFYWSSIIFEGKKLENYGDLLSKYIVEKVSKRNTSYYNAPKKRKALFQHKHLMAIGSIMSYATKKSFVWGSGIINKTDTFENADFRTVRGPKTRQRILELGFQCPECFGDPAVLLPKFYNPQIKKKYRLGIIPHYVDYAEVAQAFKTEKDVKVIDLLTDNIESKTNDFLECEQIVSSSLHGVIVAHAYVIPALWVKFSDKLSGDNVKFYDYYASIGIDFKEELCILPIKCTKKKLEEVLVQHKELLLPTKNNLEARQEDLLNSFPF